MKPTRANKIKALHDIWAFADLIDFHGGSANFGEVHRELAAHLVAPQVYAQKEWSKAKTRKDREEFWDHYETLVQRLTLIPRGHLKSTLTILYVMWRVYRNPNLRIFFGTNIDRLGGRFIKQLKAYFEDETLQKTVWNARPHIDGPLIPVLSAAGKRRNKNKEATEEDTEALDRKLLWNAENLELIRPNDKLKEPTFAATTVNSVMTGDHYDMSVLDDIVDFRNSKTPAKREAISDWVGDLTSVVEPKYRVNVFGDTFSKVVDISGGEFVYNGTRYFEGDEYDTLLQNKDILKIRVFFRSVFKNGVDDTDGYLWPEGFGAREYRRVHNEMQVKGLMRRFFAQYHNKIVSGEESLRKYAKVQWVDNSRWKYVKPGHATLIPTENEELEGKLPINIRLTLAVDPAKSLATSADYTAISLGGYDHQGNFYLVDSRYGRYKPSEFLGNLYDIINRWELSAIVLDQNGVGAYLPQVISEYARKKGHRIVNTIKYHHKQERKEERIERMLQPLLDMDAFYARQSISNNTEFMTEMNLFPKANNHDDVLDSISMVADIAFRTQQQAKQKPGRRYTRSARRVNKMFGGTR